MRSLGKLQSTVGEIVDTCFWDASLLVPLCVRQQPSQTTQRLLVQYEIAVWWAAPVEMRSAFERLLRTQEITASEYAEAGLRLEELRLGWREVQPTEEVRFQAEQYLAMYPLKAADALQLAAAWIWSSGTPKSRVFLSSDAQLIRAAVQVGFQTVTT